MRISRRSNGLSPMACRMLMLYVEDKISSTELKNYHFVQQAIDAGLTHKMNNFIRYHRRQLRILTQLLLRKV